jgi:DNA-binding CsgD family transcriptional regulator/tetratricopeptide (TPR) repeat protein
MTRGMLLSLVKDTLRIATGTLDSRRREVQAMTEDSSPLLGRQHELVELEQALTQACAGEGRLILLAGGAGSGKSRLLETCVAGSNIYVLSGTATEPTAPPYGPIVMALRSALRVMPDAVVGCGSLAQHLGLILPELGTPTPTTRETLIEAIRCLIVSMTYKSPVMLVLDDLQWSDNATLELLPFLAASCAHERLLILGAYRNDEIPRGHPIRRLRNDLRRARVLHEIVLEPLDEVTATALATRIVGYPLTPSVAAALIARAEGIPLFVEELASALRTAGSTLAHQPGAINGEPMLEAHPPIPDTLRDALLLRLDSLPEPALRLLELATVIGSEIDLTLLEKLADNLDGIETLLARGVWIEVAPGHIAFRHALAREAIYNDISWVRRRTLHHDVAALLEVDSASPQMIAKHWLAAREPARACVAWGAAAREAAAMFAYRDAAAAAQCALELWPEDTENTVLRLQLLDQLGRYAQLCGMLPEAVRAWREAATGWRDIGELGASAEAERNLANANELQGHWERVLTARQSAADAFAATGRHAEAAIELLSAAAHLRSAARFHGALELLSTAAEEAKRAGRGDLQSRIAGLEGNVLARMGQGDEGLERVRKALAHALELNDAGAAAEVYQRLADSLEHVGDYAGAQDTYLTAFAFCQTNAISANAQLCIACLTVVLRQTGEWERAMKLCREVLASEHSSLHSRAVAEGMLGTLYGLCGRPRRAEPLLTEAAALARKIELAAMELLTAWGLAQIADIRGHNDIAAEHCQDILRRWEQVEECHYAVPALRWAATFFASTRATTQIRACINALAQIASRSGQAETLSALAHALGEHALLDGDTGQAVQQFDQALDLLRDVNVPYCRALTEWRVGAAHVAFNRTDTGILHLKSAYRTASKLGARPLAVRISHTLREIGTADIAPNRRLNRVPLAAVKMTRRQLEILQHVACGRTSAEIAHLLFLSPRTVEMHVGNILATLDSRSRAEAVRRAADLGLLDSPHQLP